MRVRIIAIIFGFIIILAAVYVFFGKNWFAEQQYIQKQKNTEFIKNELMEKFLTIQEQSQEILNEILNQSYELEFFPHQEISLEIDWKRKLNFKLTKRPFFDYKQIYLISNNELRVLNKKKERIKWVKTFEEEISNFELLDANRLLVLTKKRKAFCLNRDNGNILWEKECDFSPDDSTEKRTVFQISLDKYKRLDSSVILMFADKEIVLLNNINGKILSMFVSENKIHFISEFDLLEKCIYIAEEKSISKIVINVK